MVTPAVTVIGVSGPPGSGKSTWAGALAQALGDAEVVDMDHYQRMTELPIAAVAQWFARGADHDELPVPLLAEHLALLKQGRAVVDPATGRTLAPRRYILLETHFGRAHRATGGLIDLLLWLDTPADVALARNLRVFLSPLLGAQASASQRLDGLRWIDGYLDHYLVLVSDLVRLQRARVRPAADLHIADQTSLDALLDDIRRSLSAGPG